MNTGLHYVYTGNVHDREGDTTFCHACHAPLIVRDRYEILEYRLTPEGRCPECNTSLAGRFEAQVGHFGRQRIPVVLHRA